MNGCFGVDLSRGPGTATALANETGLAQLAQDGRILDAGWARGVDEVVAWIVARSLPGDVPASGSRRTACD